LKPSFHDDPDQRQLDPEQHCQIAFYNYTIYI
jgi:hypothetical protein